MIRRIKIENYKSLRNVEVELRPLTVIFGPNAAGKSNLFDALNLVARIVTSRNLKEAFEQHRGLPLESVQYSKGSFADLLRNEKFDLMVVGRDANCKGVVERRDGILRVSSKSMEQKMSSPQFPTLTSSVGS